MLLGVDVGGTFTDAVMLAPQGTVYAAKVPSTPAEEAVGVLAAVQALLDAAAVGGEQVTRFAHGMTVATNALLEGRGARTALIATAGFTDVIELARQNRPQLYDLCAAPPPPLVPRRLRFGAPERMGVHGTLRRLDPQLARTLVEQLAEERPEAVAVALLHSYRDPAHERQLGELLAELMPDCHVSLSSELVGTFREYERTATTVIDAALAPLLSSYLSRLSTGARGRGLPEPEVMQSSGGLTDLATAGAHAALTVLSGPAGGVAGARLLAELAGEPDVLCFDMGGTSCDVCLIEDGRVLETAERTIAGRPLALPALDIHTVGAGGGSIAWRDRGGALRVGPASAGARPGPACYGLGGSEPTVTDANLLLGRLPADAPLGGAVTLDRAAAEAAVAELAAELGLGLLHCAEGIVRVAEAEMLGALRLMTVERGIDPRGLTLMPFGGAGPLHAVALARELGISRILCPRASGVLSALGLAAAAPRRDLARTVIVDPRELSPAELAALRGELIARAGAALGATPARARVRHELRYRGQSFELAVEEQIEHPDVLAGTSPETVRAGMAGDELVAAFADAHEQRYGYREQDGAVELVTMRVSVWGKAPTLLHEAARSGVPSVGTSDVVFAGQPLPTAVLRGAPEAGMTMMGPLLWDLGQATVLVEPGWGLMVDAYGSLVLERANDA